MDNKKLDKWAELLLDTGKRNNLVNYKDSKSSTVEILIPDANTLFKKIDGNARLEVFDPKISDDDDNEDENLLDAKQTEDDEEKRALYISTYSARIKKQNQILIYNHKSNPINVLKNIDKKAKTFKEEMGLNVAYIAFGFIHWKEKESSENILRAPILLAPIQFERESAIKPYYIRLIEDDIIANPTFAYKINAEHGVHLPEYNEDDDFYTYLQKVREIVTKLKWTVSEDIRIGIFSFQKINMYKDLMENKNIIINNPNVRKLLGESADFDNLGLYESSSRHVSNPLIELHNVVDADSSQIEAIELAKSGRSFVLQGPPGTGKSQTITNIIAECLSDGKRILFVSEKLAALNVVYNKLKQVNLSEFCLELHSHKANKKDVIAELCRTLYEGKHAVKSNANTEIRYKQQAQQALDTYADDLHIKRDGIGKSLYQLYESYSKFRSIPEIEWIIPDITTTGEDYLIEVSALLNQYIEYTKFIGYDYKKNPWYGYLGQDTSYQTKQVLKTDLQFIVSTFKKLVPIIKDIRESYKISAKNLNDVMAWRTFFGLVSTTDLITPSLLREDIFNTTYSYLKKMQQLSTDIISAQNMINSNYDVEIYHLNGTDFHKRLTRQYTSIFDRLVNKEYKTLIAELRLCKKTGGRLSYGEAVQISENLSRYQQSIEEYTTCEQSISVNLGSAYKGVQTDWNYVIKQFDTLRTLFAVGISFKNFIDCPPVEFFAEKDNFANIYRRLEEICKNFHTESFNRIKSSFDIDLFNPQTQRIDLVYTKYFGCFTDIDKLNSWCDFKILLSQMKEKQLIPYLDYMISQNVEIQLFSFAYEKQFYRQWIELITSNPDFPQIHRIEHDNLVKTFVEKDWKHFEINKAIIRNILSSSRPSSDMVTDGSAIGILKREGEKKRRQKSIRLLLSEIGELAQILKPCFLMSPLSVSTFLTSDSIHFDVVIFDEASQIYPQDAVGAVYRADQLIVVGDSKQMPPSNFFSSMLESDNVEEEAGDVTDFESFLDLSAASMPQLRLNWHYRSRYEQLIMFSNKNFYDNSLVTFPSSKADTCGIGVDYYYVNGIMDRKNHTNRKEAEFVINLIYKNIDEYPDRSLGVVCFSIAQQNLIDKLLYKYRQSRPDKEDFFKEAKEEPFFIKNLETVQGDERDTIIFSIGYGYDNQGKFIHHFGPLNNAGGERRLNVAVTRAKHNVQLISSIHCTDIDLARTSSKGVALLREYLEFAEKGEEALVRSITVNTTDEFDSDFEFEVCEFLRDKGFSVDTQVGCSGYRIDLGLKRPDSSDYVLAIECDGATYHSLKNARDRDRLRQQILEGMGWKFYRIWSTDWFYDRVNEQERLLDAVKGALNAAPALQEQIPDDRPSAKESFEVPAIEWHYDFPKYKAADIDSLGTQYFESNFLEMIKSILEVEAPISEEFLLKRIVKFFGQKRVTNKIKEEYDKKMASCNQLGIIRNNGFLYLQGKKSPQLRVEGDIKRDIKYISPFELANGMLIIIKQNVNVEKKGLYQILARYCGAGRLGNEINDYFDSTLNMLAEKNLICINEDRISINEK